MGGRAAAQNGDVEIIQVLMHHGASLTPVDMYGQTAFDLAKHTAKLRPKITKSLSRLNPSRQGPANGKGGRPPSTLVVSDVQEEGPWLYVDTGRAHAEEWLCNSPPGTFLIRQMVVVLSTDHAPITLNTDHAGSEHAYTENGHVYNLTADAQCGSNAGGAGAGPSSPSSTTLKTTLKTTLSVRTAQQTIHISIMLYAGQWHLAVPAAKAFPTLQDLVAHYTVHAVSDSLGVSLVTHYVDAYTRMSSMPQTTALPDRPLKSNSFKKAIADTLRDESLPMFKSYSVPYYWAHTDASKPAQNNIITRFMRRKCEAVLRSTVLHSGGCRNLGGLLNVTVTRVLRVENTMLWTKFCRRKDQVREQLAIDGAPKRVHVHKDHTVLDGGLNEMYLFHGTSPATAEIISQRGFNEMKSKEGMYGAGIYCADASCKAFQYSQGGETAEGERVIIYSRVVLGDAYRTTRLGRSSSLYGIRRPPHKPGALPGVTHDSVVAERGGVSGQVHREFIVYDGHLIYPEFLIYFKRLRL